MFTQRVIFVFSWVGVFFSFHAQASLSSRHGTRLDLIGVDPKVSVPIELILKKYGLEWVVIDPQLTRSIKANHLKCSGTGVLTPQGPIADSSVQCTFQTNEGGTVSLAEDDARQLVTLILTARRPPRGSVVQQAERFYLNLKSLEIVGHVYGGADEAYYKQSPCLNILRRGAARVSDFAGQIVRVL